jgi:isopentenyl-diphosphate Delta-isomerase
MTTDSGATSRRKLDHVRINLERNVTSHLTTGLERYRMVHRALPEINLADVTIAGTFLGLPFAAPLLISSMTGGAAGLESINMRLAEAAQARRVALGIGSQRAMLEASDLASTFRVRSLAPDVVLLANLGAVQLNYGYGVEECRRAVAMIDANALVLHLNPLQEALQPEGDTRWSGLLTQIEAVARAIEVPIIVKEVGWGISAAEARRLTGVGVAAIDVAGAGGTSWSEVERHRAPATRQQQVAGSFASWGIPTAECLVAVRQALPQVPVIASGGLRDGIDVAKVLALGADLAGMAGPFLKAAASSAEAVVEQIDVLSDTLRIAMFAVGARDLGTLREASVIEKIDA